MKNDAAARASELVRRTRVAALATVHDGGPGVAFVPYAVAPAAEGLLVLVSALSAHTRDLFADPHVALLIAEADHGRGPPHALARVSLQAKATAIARDAPAYAPARAAYATRFPDMAMLFDLGDFTLFLLVPTAVRVVTGFAQARTLRAETLLRALGGRVEEGD